MTVSKKSSKKSAVDRRELFPDAFRVGSKKLPFDKYDFYQRAVQSPEIDARFFRNVYRELRDRDAVTLREDFCGTFLVTGEWVKLSKAHLGIGLDLDPEPIEYGKCFHLPKLSKEAQSRIQILGRDVLSHDVPAADIVVSLNFSFFFFKEREVVKKYFANVLRSLKPGGIFVCDMFGGPACQKSNLDKSRRPGFQYQWEQISYNPINQHARFEIHFRPNGSRLYRNVFHYEWRMWSIPEVRDMMREVGFRESHVYWEGDQRKGSGGSGVFRRKDKGDEAEAWIAYVAGMK
jgi:SAM-dependent methyltransferase